GFFVESGFAWNSGRIGRLNIFGMTSPDKDIVNAAADDAARLLFGDGLRELWWDGSQWNWSDHGAPPGTNRVMLGRNSAVWDPALQQGRVLVAADSHGGLPQLWDRFWDGSQWSWSQLGNPLGTDPASNDQVVEMWPPVMVDGVQNGTYVVTAFVV